MRLPTEVMKRVDLFRWDPSVTKPGVSITRSAAVKMLIEMGLTNALPFPAPQKKNLLAELVREG